MVLDLIVIGTAITLGPLHNSAFILLLSSRRGVRLGLAFLLSWLANLIAVIAVVVLLTGGQPPAPDSAPSTAATDAKLAIGLALVLYSAYRHRRPPHPHSPPRWTARIDDVSSVAAGGLAWVFQPWALVGAATAVDADLCLDGNGADVYTFSCNGGAYQKWKTTSGSAKSIRHTQSGKYLDANGTVGAQVVFRPRSGPPLDR